MNSPTIEQRRAYILDFAETVARERHYEPKHRVATPVISLVVPGLAAAVVWRPVAAFEELVRACADHADFSRTPGLRDNRDDTADDLELSGLEERVGHCLDVLMGRARQAVAS